MQEENTQTEFIEIKTKLSEIKNISQGLLTDRHFRISDLEDTAREIIQNKTQKKNKD